MTDVMPGWIGVDLDGTLAKHDGVEGPLEIGEPIGPMVDRVRQWLAEGKDVRIFTARKSIDVDGSITNAIEEWCEAHFGRRLPVTCTKSHDIAEIWDDKAVQIIPNTGQRADGAE
jgi:hypothetical protein